MIGVKIRSNSHWLYLKIPMPDGLSEHVLVTLKVISLNFLYHAYSNTVFYNIYQRKQNPSLQLQYPLLVEFNINVNAFYVFFYSHLIII